MRARAANNAMQHMTGETNVLQSIIDKGRVKSKKLVLMFAMILTLGSLGAVFDGRWSPGRPEYRPMTYQQFVSNYENRQRYYTEGVRSFAGWPKFKANRPNSAHYNLAKLESMGKILHVVTQNVDGLHQAGGSANVIELHGSLDRTICLDCCGRESRDSFQDRMQRLNQSKRFIPSEIVESRRPDGDVELNVDYTQFNIPLCRDCSGSKMKPDVVFFGENVPKDRVEFATELVHDCQAVLAIGTTLSVFSGYRFTKLAAELEKPIAIVNDGPTRADGLSLIKMTGRISPTLEQVTRMTSKGEESDQSLGKVVYSL